MKTGFPTNKILKHNHFWVVYPVSQILHPKHMNPYVYSYHQWTLFTVNLLGGPLNEQWE